MLGCGDSEIADDAAMKHFRIVKVHQLAREVRTIAGDDIELHPVWFGVVLANQAIVLFFGSIDVKTVNRPNIASPDQFDPATGWWFSIRAVGSNGLEVSDPISISQKVD